jgi:hypothetical protein
MGVNNWTEAVAYNKFYLALRAAAKIWANSIVTFKSITHTQKSFTFFKPMFKQEFATQTDDKLIINDLTIYIMRPNEQCRNYRGQRDQIMDMFDESYNSYQVMLDRPQEHASVGHYNNNTVTNYVNQL